LGKIVIWGLRSSFHSHKFIHQAFFRSLVGMGFEAAWIDDKASNSDLVKPGDTVFAVDVASKFLPIVKGAKYVLHNIDPASKEIETNYINLQVFTKSSSGQNQGVPYVLWDTKSKTLYQPWGVPVSQSEWLTPKLYESRVEYWIGSIWNNELNQGNSNFMTVYKKSLGKHNLKFKQKGTTTILKPNGLSEVKAASLINRSPVGAAVVGNWQKENKYVPCRLFKNVAAGALPSSNSDFSELFGEGIGVFESDPENLIQNVMDVSFSQKVMRVKEAQNKILPYTYDEGVARILHHLESSN
jgi:hypothetical protein